MHALFFKTSRKQVGLATYFILKDCMDWEVVSTFRRFKIFTH